MTFNTSYRELGLLQGLTELVSVPQDHFSQDKTEQKLERLHMTPHSLDPSLHLCVGCCTHRSLLQQLDVGIVYTCKRIGTESPPCWAQGSHTRSIVTNLLLQLTQLGLPEEE